MFKTGHTIRGNWSKTFDKVSLKNNSVKKGRYQVSKKGKFTWSHRIGYHSFSLINSQNINPLNAVYSVNLLVKSLNKNQILKLKGPLIEDLPFRLKIKKTGFRELNFFETFNPFQKGGFFDWQKSLRRYGECQSVKEKAKQIFLIRFNKK